MIDFYFWPTPNGHKVTLLLEEAGIEYKFFPVDISTGGQLKPAFLAFSPSNRMPAIIDHAPADGGEAVPVFESGAILLYFAEKCGQFLPVDLRGRKTVLEWLLWQMGGLGPMAGQNQHFAVYAPERIPYATKRYVDETNRLYGVLDRRLASREFIAGDEYTIADMASYPWVVPHEAQGQRLEDTPNLKRWLDAIHARPGTTRAYGKGKAISDRPAVTEASKSILFGQTGTRPAA